MKKTLLIIMILISVKFFSQSQNYAQLLVNDWVKVKTRMLDGSKDITESYVTSKFYNWHISSTKICIRSEAIYIQPNSCINYELEKNFVRTSQNSGYEIAKIDNDSLVIIEKINGVKDKDKIKKMWFVKSSKIRNHYKENTKNDSLLALRH